MLSAKSDFTLRCTKNKLGPNRMFKFFVVLVSSFAIFACSDNRESEVSPESSSRSQSMAAKESEKSSVRISGDQNFVFEHKIVFSCVKDTLSLTTFTQSPKFELYLPANITEGTYPLADYDANRDVPHLAGKAVVAISGKMVPGSGSGYGKFYFKNNTGQLVIKTMPNALGEEFVASLNGSLQSSDGGEIIVDAKFDMLAEGYTVSDCQF